MIRIKHCSQTEQQIVEQELEPTLEQEIIELEHEINEHCYRTTFNEKSFV